MSNQKQYEIGKKDGKAASHNVWTAKTQRERIIYLQQYFTFRDEIPQTNYGRGFVDGFCAVTMEYGSC